MRNSCDYAHRQLKEVVMYKEYPISKELEEASWKDNLFIDFIPVSSDPEHSVVLCVVCAKDGKRVVRGGEVIGGGQEAPFLQAMENAKAAALSVFYGKELPELNNGKIASSDKAASSPGGSPADSQVPSGRTAGQSRGRTAPENNLPGQTEPVNAASNTSAAKQAESATTGRQNSAPVNRQQAASVNRQSAGSANRQSPPAANRQQAASTNRQQTAPTNRQTAASQNRQPSSSPQQPAVPANQTNVPAAGQEAEIAGMSGDDDFRVIIGPYAKKENNYISWIVENDLDFIRRICNLTNPLPTYAETIKNIKDYVKNHGIAL